jgi:predicted transcriptional regulator
MTRQPVLDLEMRRRLFATVQAYPGLHVRELARQLDTSMALVEYHLALLHQNGLVAYERTEGFLRVFPAPAEGRRFTPTERQRLGLLRAKVPLRITLFLLDREAPTSHKSICEGLGMGKSALSFHLRKLEAAGVVRKTPDGSFEPADRTRLQALLLENQPTPDIKQEFADLWLSLYGDA